MVMARANPGQKIMSQPKKKQAVVVVHGMGEQRPLETVRSFVKNVWKDDSNIKDSRFWSVPSPHQKSYEQRCYTTSRTTLKKAGSKNNGEAKVDFYGFYWAHHTTGTEYEKLKGWLKSLIFRKPEVYERHRVKHVWWVLLVASLVILIMGSVQVCAASDRVPQWIGTMSCALRS